jgi:hypothetical protein
MTAAATINTAAGVLDTTVKACGLESDAIVVPERIEASNHGVKGYTRNGELCFAYTYLKNSQHPVSSGLEAVLREWPLSGVSLGHLLKTGEWMVKIFR